MTEYVRATLRVGTDASGDEDIVHEHSWILYQFDGLGFVREDGLEEPVVGDKAVP